MMKPAAIADPVRQGVVIPVTAWGAVLLRKLASLSGTIAESWPRSYLFLAGLFAVAGYLWLLLFPWLVISGAMAMYEAAFGSHPVAWGHISAWLVVSMAAALVCYRLYGFRPEPPAGRLLDSTSHQALLQLVADLSGHYRGIRVDRVVLSDEFGLEIARTPRMALPLSTTNTLVVGLPLMQCLSVRQFQCALARRLGQFSGRYNRVVHALNSLRTLWQQYCDRGRVQETGFEPVAWFFRLYAPFYAAISTPAACLDELAADRYAMELFSDEDMLDLITTDMVCRQYLEEKYWPVVRKYAAKNSRVVDRLHSGMASVLRAGLGEETAREWLSRTISAEQDCDSGMPSLARRLDNIGFDSTHMGVLSSAPAANVYLE